MRRNAKVGWGGHFFSILHRQMYRTDSTNNWKCNLCRFYVYLVRVFGSISCNWQNRGSVYSVHTHTYKVAYTHSGTRKQLAKQQLTGTTMSMVLIFCGSIATIVQHRPINWISHYRIHLFIWPRVVKLKCSLCLCSTTIIRIHQNRTASTDINVDLFGTFERFEHVQHQKYSLRSAPLYFAYARYTNAEDCMRK